MSTSYTGQEEERFSKFYTINLYTDVENIGFGWTSDRRRRSFCAKVKINTAKIVDVWKENRLNHLLQICGQNICDRIRALVRTKMVIY